MREAALDAIIEGALTLPECITKLFVLRPPTPDRDGRDVERFREIAVRSAAPAEAAGDARELGPVARRPAAATSARLLWLDRSLA
jgi:hypothetical protein